MNDNKLMIKEIVHTSVKSDLKYILKPEGYSVRRMTGGYAYNYYLKDHLGNNRVVADQAGNEEQSTQYYPFGMVMKETNGDKQAFKFGGKELDMMNGLNLYDFVARGYDPATGWFLTPDPLAEKYPWISLYVYCLNNPLNAVDRDGRLVIFVNRMHSGNGGSAKYTAMYKDGSVGGYKNLLFNMDASYQEREKRLL